MPKLRKLAPCYLYSHFRGIPLYFCDTQRHKDWRCENSCTNVFFVGAPNAEKKMHTFIIKGSSFINSSSYIFSIIQLCSSHVFKQHRNEIFTALSLIRTRRSLGGHFPKLYMFVYVLTWALGQRCAVWLNSVFLKRWPEDFHRVTPLLVRQYRVWQRVG